MTSRRMSIRISGLVFAAALAAPGNARAQFSFDDYPCFPYPPSGDFGLSAISGIDIGISPFGYGSFGVTGYGGFGGIGAFPSSGYGWNFGQCPQTATSFQPLVDVIAGIPRRSGRARRIPRKPRRVQVAAGTLGHVSVPESVRQPGESSSASIIKYESLASSRNP